MLICVQSSFFFWFEINPVTSMECLTWYPIVLDRHHSRRICLILLALDTPKLWERFSFGLESTGLGRLSWERSKQEVFTWIDFEKAHGCIDKKDNSITCCFQSPASQKWTCVPGLQCFEVKSGTSQALVCAQYLCRRINLLAYPHSWCKEIEKAEEHFSSVKSYWPYNLYSI